MPITIPSPAAKRRARIEIIPLIDIIFFLLATFVMVSLSMVKNRGLSVNLPVAATAQPQDRKDFASITITAQGDLAWDKQAVTTAELELRLKDLHAWNPDPKIFINGDTDARYGRAIEVLDIVRRAGIAKIGIETKAKSTSAPATPAAPHLSATPAVTPP